MCEKCPSHVCAQESARFEEEKTKRIQELKALKLKHFQDEVRKRVQLLQKIKNEQQMEKTYKAVRCHVKCPLFYMTCVVTIEFEHAKQLQKHHQTREPMFQVESERHIIKKSSKAVEKFSVRKNHCLVGGVSDTCFSVQTSTSLGRGASFSYSFHVSTYPHAQAILRISVLVQYGIFRRVLLCKG